MASSAPLATSHTLQRFAGGGPSFPAQTARTSPDEYHKPHAAVLLLDRRDDGGTGLRCQGWPSFQPPERTHSRAAVMVGSPLDSAGDAGPEGRGRVAEPQSRGGVSTAVLAHLRSGLAAARQQRRRHTRAVLPPVEAPRLALVPGAVLHLRPARKEPSRYVEVRSLRTMPSSLPSDDGEPRLSLSR